MKLDIHNFARKNEYMRARIQTYGTPASQTVLSFLDHLVARGTSEARVCFYATKAATILRLMKENGLAFTFKEATKEDVEKIMAVINSATKRQFKAHTRAGLALTLKKVVQYAKTGRTDREQPFPPEVAWVKTLYREDNPRVTADKVLREEDFVALMSHVNSPRDRAMLYVFYEGAFRPGELLNMKVGSVQFLDRYAVVTTRGKTGEKRIPLVISMRPLLEWLKQHPDKDEPDAPLWPSLSSRTFSQALSYFSFIRIVKQTARRAGMNRDVWPYLFRHSRLTFLADKLTESKLDQFAGWTMGSKMARTYVHFSGRDLDASVLSVYGIKTDEHNNESILKPAACPRCQNVLMPDQKRCPQCGLVVDPVLAAKLEARAADRERKEVQELARRIERIEGELNSLQHRPDSGVMLSKEG
jgi:integrase/recombinase XerD